VPEFVYCRGVPMNYELRRFVDGAEQAACAASEWLLWLKAAPAGVSVALSGGTSAERFFVEAQRQTHSRTALFLKPHFFWADERCVPSNSPESNYGLACHCLFDPAKVRPARIHRIQGELPPADAVSAANAEADRWVRKDGAGRPAFDLVLLGMGEDGHIASLFPNAPDRVTQSQSVYVWVEASPKPPSNRISLTYNALCAAKEVWVMTSGASKRAALARSLAPDGNTPLASLLRQRTKTLIFSDSID
jgi:6-phosphogluconolactonase